MAAGDGRAVHAAGNGVSDPLPSDPQRIGDYQVLGVLGSGGMGRVYLGLRYDAAGRPQLAAVKRVHAHLATDARFLQYFGHELDNLARLPRGLSADLLDSDRHGSEPWFATEYIPGITLDQALEIGDALPEPCLWLLLRDVALTLAAVHELGIVHRDLKPSNIILTLDGVKVIDFGVARAADQSRATMTGHVVGTPAFMAPEQATGVKELTSAADVFALGSLLAYAAQGEPPFGLGSAPDQLYRVVHAEPNLEALSLRLPRLTQVIAACLTKAPDRRPSAAGLIAKAEPNVPAYPLGATGTADSVWPPEIATLIRQRTVYVANAMNMFQRGTMTPPPAGVTSRSNHAAAAVVATLLVVGGLAAWAIPNISHQSAKPPFVITSSAVTTPPPDPPTTYSPSPTASVVPAECSAAIATVQTELDAETSLLNGLPSPVPAASASAALAALSDEAQTASTDLTNEADAATAPSVKAAIQNLASDFSAYSSALASHGSIDAPTNQIKSDLDALSSTCGLSTS